METHTNHIHTAPGKKWTHYLFEFFMLFLAVFCGFLAENLREHTIETNRAKELAASLYQEVYADSVTMHNKISMRLQKEDKMQYFRRYVLDSNLTNLSEMFYPSFAWTTVLTTTIIFEPNDGILTQLRNSGMLRYFKSTHLQNCISHIAVAISNARDRNTQEYHFIEQFIRPFALKHYDFRWMDGYTQNGKLSILQALQQDNFLSAVKPVIKNLQDFNRQDAEGVVAYYLLVLRATRQLHYQAYIEKNHELLEALRDEFGFK